MGRVVIMGGSLAKGEASFPFMYPAACVDILKNHYDLMLIWACLVSAR